MEPWAHHRHYGRTALHLKMADAQRRDMRERPSFRKNWFFKEFVQIFQLAWPTALGYACQQVIFFVSLTFCGHVGSSSTILESVALAQSIVNITGLSFVIGYGSGLDTLASQAWGAENYKKVGIYLQRAFMVHLLIAFFVLGIWFNAETVLNLLHQPPGVVEYSVQYIQISTASLPAMFMYILLQKYLQSQNIVYPFILTGIFANIVNTVAHYLFLFVANWGVRGAAGAVGIAWYTNLFSLLIIIYVRKLHVKTWGGWSRESLKDWGQFARYGIPGLLMVIVELGSFEIGYYITGFIGMLQQAIHAVLAAYVYVIFMIPVSLGVAVSVRVGNELGAGCPSKAKRAAFVGLVIDAAWITLVVVFTVSLKDYIPMIFTSDPAVLQAMGPIMYVTAALLIGDNLQGYLAGVLRGSGTQFGGAAANFFSYWMVGVPLGIVLAMVVHLGALGFWLGLLTGEFIQVFIYMVVILTIRWKKQAVKAQKMASGQEKLESPVHEKSPLIQAEDSHPTYDSNIWSREEVESSLVVSGHHGHQDRPPPVKLGCGTIVIRLLTCSVFVVFLISGVALSQLCVYRCDMDVGNYTNVTNTTTLPPVSNYTCQWIFTA